MHCKSSDSLSAFYTVPVEITYINFITLEIHEFYMCVCCLLELCSYVALTCTYVYVLFTISLDSLCKLCMNVFDLETCD